MVLEIVNLSLRYGSHEVLKNVQLKLTSGMLYGLVGINGSGKTSFFNSITGLISHSGNVMLDGRPMLTRDVAFLESSIYAYPNMTGRDYLLLFAVNNPSFNPGQWNAVFGLPLDEYISNYSSGMQKKLGIMGILALDRKVILLDEPFNALDLEAVELLKQLLPELKKKDKIIIVSSHILETLTETCDYLLYLEQGQIDSVFEKSRFNELHTYIKSHLHTKYKDEINNIFRN